MKNLKQRIESRREMMDEESGFGDKKRKGKERTYEDDFDDMASIAEMESKVKELEQSYKKARSEDEKMKILRKKTELKAKIQMAKEEG